MNATRVEIMSDVYLTHVNTNKFKTGCLSMHLLTQLHPETAARNALIPRVLRRGSKSHPDMESVLSALGDLYGARIEPTVRKIGELQLLGFYADFADDAFVPEDEKLLEKVCSMLGELLLSPNTRGGLFLPEYVDSEKTKLLEQIRARINDKRSYSLLRLFELMCFGEAYAVDRLGSEAQAESISYTGLTRHYKETLSSSPIEIFYCGSAAISRVRAALKEALLTLPRSEPNKDLGTDIRMNSVEEEPRIYTEELDVTQGKLAIGFRLGDSMYEPDQAALRVFNAVYGGSVTSKLFTNVREKLSLCYYASSTLDLHKGILAVSSGIEFDQYDAALNEILLQLEMVKKGEVTAEELDSAARYVASSLRAAMDSPVSLESFYLSQSIEGYDYSPRELAALCGQVTKEEVVKIAGSTECDAIYFLKGLSEDSAHEN